MNDRTLVEPSNDEQSQWPEATEAYVRDLEEINEAQATRIKALEAALRLTPIIGSTEDVAAFRKREDEWYRKYYLPLMEGSGNG